MKGNPGGNLRAGLEEGLVGTLTNQAPKVIHRYAQVGTVAHQAFLPTDQPAVRTPQDSRAEVMKINAIQPNSRRSAENSAKYRIQLIRKSQPTPIKGFLVVSVLQTKMHVAVFIRQYVGIGQPGARGAKRRNPLVCVLQREPEAGSPAILLPFHSNRCKLVPAIRPQPLAAHTCGGLKAFFDARESRIQVDPICKKLREGVILRD